MPIDTSGECWKGQNFDDLAEYIRQYTEDGYPAERVVQSVCVCGHTAFQLWADEDEGCARRRCIACGAEAFIGDSEEYWDEAEPKQVRCPCKHDLFEIAVGFSLRQGEQDEVKWITVGERCVRCGVLGSAVDWKIDYSPSGHLLTMA